VVTRLQEINAIVADAVHQAVLLRNTPRPTTSEQIPERLGLAGPSNGSRKTASINSTTRIAALRSDLTQYRRSSRNSE